MKILFIAANVHAGEQLALDEEYRSIEQAIRAGRHRDQFQLIPKLAARRSDVQDALLEHSPDVVHFACHGSTQAELLLLADGAGSDPLPAPALASLFDVLRDNLVLVVFNACFASLQASAIQGCAGLAIGMHGAVNDRAAIAFASALYGALAYGRSVGDAFALGAAAAASADPAQRCPSQLFTAPGVDASQVRLVRDPRHRQTRRVLGWVVACAVLLFAASSPAWREPDDQEPTKPASPGMVRFAGASIRPGVFAPALRPPQCKWLTAREDCAELEHPESVEVVHIEPFELDQMEVTNAEYGAWLNANPTLWRLTEHGIITTPQVPGIPLLRTEKCGDGLTISPESKGRVHVPVEATQWPIVCVTWYGAREYCLAQYKRLPLDVEWELAAKGATGRPFPWGTALPQLDSVAFDRRNSTAVHPRTVGTSSQDVTPEGIRDLGGNAAEWVDDRRGRPDEKTVRGGGFGSTSLCKLLGSGCSRIPPDKQQRDIGFRCARSVIEPHRGGGR